MTRFQLSEPQQLILGSACQRPDGYIFPVEHAFKGGAVGNVCKSLLARGLIEEICCAAPDVVCRYDEALGPLTLRATPLAYSALGLRDDEASLLTSPGVHSYAIPKDNRAEQLIDLLREPGGASMADIQTATGWQALPSLSASERCYAKLRPRAANWPRLCLRSAFSSTPAVG